MEIEIYADILFILNFLMIFFIFWIVGKILRKNIKIFRIFLGSFISSLIYCLIFLLRVNLFLNTIGITFIIFLGIIITFNTFKMLEILYIFLCTNIVSFAVGGGAIALFYYTNISNILGNFISFSFSKFPLKLLFSSIGITYLAIKIFVYYYNKSILKKQCFKEIILNNENNNVSINALIDTGNSLCEPISKKPVIIVDTTKINTILPENILKLYNNNRNLDISEILIGLKKYNYNKPFRVIPFNSLGNKNGLIVGIEIDNIYIDNQKIERPFLGITSFKLCKNGKYQALLNPEILQ